ncbi:MAG: Hsp70 family protein [Myxococcota bacterium]|nr:Hsp70 family protein [Myxococcota bacterium]
MSDVILGIDLGTTFSAMAVVDQFGKSTVLPNADGHPTTPSVVHFYEQGSCVVGEEAVKSVVADPGNSIRFVKRLMGEDIKLDFYGDEYTPQAISALILKKLKADAEEALGHPIEKAVITVPAYFNSAQRSATAEAGRLAGFDVLSMINEPTAAAIAHGLEKFGAERRVLVFDLGGGTFDVTIMDIGGITFKTIASDGNAELGGKDWDDRLVNHVAEAFAAKHDADPRDEPQPYQELYERCLAAKIALSSKPKAVIPVNYKGSREAITVTRDEFEAMTQDLVQQCEETANLLLAAQDMSWDDVDEVLLVGGSTKMPMIRGMVERLASKATFPGVSPDEGVAVGANLAGVLRHQPKHPALKSVRQALKERAKGKAPKPPEPPPDATEAATVSPPPPPGIPNVDIQDSCTHPLGVVALDADLNEMIVTLIDKSTPVPCECQGRFAYAYDGMTAVQVEVTEGQGTNRDEVFVVGQIVLEDLPPRPRGTPIDVVYRYNVNQILEVDVVDVETQSSCSARLHLLGELLDLEAAEDQVSETQVR